MSFPPNERAEQEHEFHEIVIDDCYHLNEIKEPVRTILDIGANIGPFAIAARHHFPTATIHCYEPNRALEKHLAAHCSGIGAQYFIEAVGSKGAAVSLRYKNRSMDTEIKLDTNGSTMQTAFADAVAKLGVVDLLKLDCEGAEWDIFSDSVPWAKVHRLRMEYHLWAKPNSTVRAVEAVLRDLGFNRIVTRPSMDGRWGFAYGQK
jgi:FkbM family methyltransferase